jgi:hypothetical protein
MFVHRRPYRTCGSGRLGASRHVWRLSTETRQKSVWVSRYFPGGFNRSAQHRLETYQLEF